MSPKLRRSLLTLPLILLALYLGVDLNKFNGPSNQAPTTAPSAARQNIATTRGNARINQAFAARESNVQAQLSGTVSRILSDDNDGSRHQRFIVSIAEGFTVLVAHNIDLAPRINDIRQGAAISVYGEYEFNPQGGVMHWTHHDPAGRHEAGWVRFDGQTYQ